MVGLLDSLSANMPYIILALGATVLIILLLVVILMFKISKLTKRHKSLMTGTEGQNLEELLETYLKKVLSAEKKVSQLNDRSEKLELYAEKSLQNVSLLRFNAFDNMGSDLSFAAAILDLNGDGFVLTSINSREESRVYAKPVKQGQSTYHLSNEEIDAIKQAIARSKDS